MKKMPIGLVGYDYHTAGDHTVQGLIVDYYNIYTSIFLSKDNISIYQNLRIMAIFEYVQKQLYFLFIV